MDVLYDDEQDALREAVRGLLATTYADHEARRRTAAAETKIDQAEAQASAEAREPGARVRYRTPAGPPRTTTTSCWNKRSVAHCSDGMTTDHCAMRSIPSRARTGRDRVAWWTAAT